MNDIILTNINPPMLLACGLLAASEPFYHMDRTACFDVLIYVTDGVIYVTEGDTDYEIHPGEMLFLKSGVRHFGKYEIKKGTRWYYFHFCECNSLPECVNDCRDATGAMSSAPIPKKLSGLQGSNIERMIEDFTEYYYSDEPMKPWRVNSRFYEILTETAFYNRSEKKSGSLTDKICAYLSKNYNKPFATRELEHEFYLSYKYMAAVFKREKGMTMQQYHTNIRMNSAGFLLRSTFMSVTEVAAAVGYNDALYFSRRFRECEGLSPSAYRKAVLETDMSPKY